MAAEWEDAPSSGWEDDPAPKQPSQLEETGEFFKGMSLPVAGAIQTIPYEPLQKSVAGYVKGIEEKPEYVRPGASIGARSLGKGIATAGTTLLPAAKGFELTAKLKGLPKLLTRTLGGAATGGLAGSVMEEAPTVEEIYPRKAEAGKTGAITGAIVTPALSGLGSLSKGAYNLVMKAQGRRVEEALQFLKGNITKEAEEARNFLMGKAAGTERAAASEAATAKDITEARYKVRGQVEKDLGAAKKETESSLKGLGPKESDEGLGKFIQTQGKRNIRSIRGTTEQEAIRELKDPAFIEARARAARGDTLSTNPKSAPILREAVADIEQQIRDVPSGFRGPLEDRIDYILGKKIPLSAAKGSKHSRLHCKNV
jgi:hypothetical protein